VHKTPLLTKPPGKNLSPLAQAALALDEQLQQFEQLAAAAERIDLDSQRNIERAARAVNDAAECQDRVARDIGALMEALNAARDRNQASADRLRARGETVQRRTDEAGELLKRFAALGGEAREVSALVQATAKQAGPSAIAQLGAIEAELGRIAEAAAELSRDANAARMTDLGGQANSLRQQMQAASNKVGLLRQRLPEPPPPH